MESIVIESLISHEISRLKNVEPLLSLFVDNESNGRTAEHLIGHRDGETDALTNGWMHM